jgi:hypothetical protein
MFNKINFLFFLDKVKRWSLTKNFKVIRAIFAADLCTSFLVSIISQIDSSVSPIKFFLNAFWIILVLCILIWLTIKAFDEI